MSIFSSKRRVVEVQTQSFNMVNEKSLHKVTQASVLQAVLTGESITEVLQNNIFEGSGLKIRNFINWADTSGYNAYIGEIFPQLTYTSLGSQSELGYFLSTEISDWSDKYTDGQTSYIDGAITIYADTGVWDAVKQATIKAIETHPDRFNYLISMYNDSEITCNLNLPVEISITAKDSETYTVLVKWSQYAIQNKQVYVAGSYEDETYTIDNLSGSSYIWLAAFHVRTTRALTGGTGGLFNPYRYSYSTAYSLVTKSAKYPTGNDILDEFYGKEAVGVEDLSKFASIVPLRYWNHSISADADPETYSWCKKATRKLFGKAKFYQELLDNINSNSSIQYIDFAYVHLGIPINCTDPDALEYLYNFFDVMYRMADPAEVPLLDINNSYQVSKLQGIGSDNVTTSYHTTHDKVSSTMRNLRAGLTLNLRTGAKANYNYNVTLSFSRILKEIIEITSDSDFPKDSDGNKRKVGSCWTGRSTYLGEKLIYLSRTMESSDHSYTEYYYAPYQEYRSGVSFYKLISETSYIKITAFDLGQENLIFENKRDILDAWVEINPYTYTPEPKLHQEVDGWRVPSIDSESDVKHNLEKTKQNHAKNNGYSALLIPIELHAVNYTSTVKFTNAAQYSVTLLFNMYEVYYVKTGGFFSFIGGFLGGILAIVGIVVSIAIPALATIGNILLTVGTGLVSMSIDNPILNFMIKVAGVLYMGVTEFLMAVIAVSISYVVPMVIPGPIGELLGMAASMYFAGGFSFTKGGITFEKLKGFVLDKLQDPVFVIDTVTNATNSFVGAATEKINAETQRIQNSLNDLYSQFVSKYKELTEAIEEYLPQNTWTKLVAQYAQNNTSANSLNLLEDQECFLTRTLMYPDEMKDLSLDLIENYADYTTDVEYTYV